MNYPEHTHRKRGLQTAQVVQVIRTESVIGTGEENEPCILHIQRKENRNG